MMPKTLSGKIIFWTLTIILGVYIKLQWEASERQEARRQDILTQNAALQKRREAATHPGTLSLIEAQQQALDRRAKALAIELGRIKE